MSTSGTALQTAVPARSSALLSREACWLALAGLVFSVLMPQHGFGSTVCMLKNATGLPCPTCGLTRSVACISHLNLADAWAYNPFGFLIWPVMLLGAVFALSPVSLRERLDRSFSSWRPWLARGLWLLLAAVVVHGIVRAAVIATAG